MFETLPLAKQEHHDSSKSAFGGFVGTSGGVGLGPQFLLPTRLVLSSNPEANVPAWAPGLRIKLAGL